MPLADVLYVDRDHAQGGENCSSYCESHCERGVKTSAPRDAEIESGQWGIAYLSIHWCGGWRPPSRRPVQCKSTLPNEQGYVHTSALTVSSMVCESRHAVQRSPTHAVTRQLSVLLPCGPSWPTPVTSINSGPIERVSRRVHRTLGLR